MEIGWIKLHRKLQDCWIWQEKPFDKGRAWVDLLLSAMHHDKKLLIDNEIVIISRGSFMTSVVKLSERWGWSRNKVFRFLKLLEDEQMLTTERTPKGTLISIVKYEDYQVLETADGTPLETTVESTNETSIRTPLETADGTQNKNIKNDKNEKNIKEKELSKDSSKKKFFIPPTVDEVKEYLISVGSKVDAESFVAFYESKDWMIGKNKMKNWKSAIVTWEKRNGLKRTKPKTDIVFNSDEVIDLWGDDDANI